MLILAEGLRNSHGRSEATNGFCVGTGKVRLESSIDASEGTAAC